MRRIPSEMPAVARTQWLAEIELALEQAQLLTWRIGLSQGGQAEGGKAEAMELYGQIEAALTEVQSLRRAGFTISPKMADPNWIESLPWSSNESSC